MTEKSRGYKRKNLSYVKTFGNIEIGKHKFYCHKSPILKKEQVLVSNEISFGEKTINTLLVTCIMIVELNHCIKCFIKQVLMLNVMIDKQNWCIFWFNMMPS